MNEKKVLTHLIRAGRDALNLENILAQFGYKETPYFNLYGEIADAVYCMLGEDTDSFEESFTHAAMNDPLTSDEKCAERLSVLIPPRLDVSDGTISTIREAAQEKGMDTAQMINLILSDWARKELLFRSAFA